MREFGFTLAEVLITLVIIGVIAALTIPTLLQNKEKQETITGLKEANALLSTAFARAKVDYGDYSTWDYSLLSDQFAITYVAPYLKISKICGTGNAESCFNAPSGSWYDLAGVLHSAATGYGSYNFYKFILNNGMSVGVWRNVSTNYYAVIAVDVNGSKGPTKIGKDVFYFSLSKFGFSPGVNKVDVYSNNFQTIYSRTALLGTAVQGGCNTGAPVNGIAHIGSACGLVILKDGWQIADDYPWN